MDYYTDNEPVKLLWSGGWDSTYRLLEVVLVEQRIVQPYYFIAPENRRSVPNERRAQKEIKEELFRRYPEVKEFVKPTIFIHTNQISPDAEIAKANQEANEIRHLGRQYEFMARYCKQQGVDGLELCVQKAVDPNWQPRFSPLMNRIEGTPKFVINHDLSDRPEYVLLKYFRFPVLGYSKLDMLEIAKEKGWMPIMRKTWFCHTPYFGRIPCGVCLPCEQAIGEGMGWRVPFYTRHLRKVWDTKFVRLLRKIIRPKKQKQRT